MEIFSASGPPFCRRSRSRACPDCAKLTNLIHYILPLCAKHPRYDAHRQNGEGYDESPHPGETLPIRVRTQGELEDRRRQTGHGRIEIGAVELIVERREQQRRRFAADAGHRKQHARDHPRPGGPIGNMADDQHAGHSQRRRGLAKLHRHQQQHVLGGPHHHGNDDHGQRHRPGESREMAHGQHQNGVDEQSDDDRRSAEQDVVDETNHHGQLGVAAVFSHVGPGQNADGRADGDPERRHDDAAHDRVQQAARAAGRRRHLGEDLEGQSAQAVPEQSPQNEHQPAQAQDRGGDAHKHQHAIAQCAARCKVAC